MRLELHGTITPTVVHSGWRPAAPVYGLSIPAHSEVRRPGAGFHRLRPDRQTVSLARLRGRQPVVLYFYPKDDTPGCTKEAYSFRDERSALQNADMALLGVCTRREF